MRRGPGRPGRRRAASISPSKVVEAREEGLHILVNNASATWGAPLEEYPLEASRQLWNIIVKAMFELTVPELLLLRAAPRRRSRRVVNIGSIDGLTILATKNYAYSTTAGRVHMPTRHLAHQFAGTDHGNALAPGP